VCYYLNGVPGHVRIPEVIRKRYLYALTAIPVALLCTFFLLNYEYIKVRYKFNRCAKALQKYDLVTEHAVSDEDEKLLYGLNYILERNPEYYLTVVIPQLRSSDSSNVLCALSLMNGWRTLCILTNEFRDYVDYVKAHKDEIDRIVLPVLPGLLSHEDVRIRHKAAELAHSFPGPEVKKSLIRLLHGGDIPEVRTAAASSLWPYREDEDVIILLVRTMVSDQSGTVRHHAFLGATGEFPENVEMSERASIYDELIRRLPAGERGKAPTWQEWWK
jgi:hypothetical protein